MDQQDIIDGLKTICICRGIRKKTFLRLIERGHATLGDLQKTTGAGTGPCGGKRCTGKIREMLESLGEKAQKPSFQKPGKIHGQE